MQYRKSERIDTDISLLGFGAMRLPLVNNNADEIDVEQAKSMIRYAIDHGVNYVDTAWVYHEGRSEGIVAGALQEGYREKVNLATKNPTWLIKKEEDWEYFLEEQLKRLQVSQIDFYLQHSLTKSSWETVKKFNLFEKGMRAKKEGRIKYYGFSFHDSYELFEEIINTYDWDFCQIQLNYLDKEYQAGLKGLELARKKNIPVIIMEPLRGGLLADSLPYFVTETMEEFKTKYRPIEWAFRWLADQSGILTILSGMSSYEQVKDNIDIFNEKYMIENNMTPEERQMIDDIVLAWNHKEFVKCTHCNYCIPCPKGVNIPENFRNYNRLIHNTDENIRRFLVGQYQGFINTGCDAGQCVSCHACEKVCPQGILISERLKDFKNKMQDHLS